MEKFKQISLVHIPQEENQMADALPNLAASLTLLKDETVHVPLSHKWVLPPLPILQQDEVIYQYSLLIVKIGENH